MLIIETLEDIAAMQESVDVECKLAQGRDGKGAIPKDMWETYSAFANTHGGDIVLGLKENAGSGLPKIFAGWNSQHWRKPLLKQKTHPTEQTLLELHTLSLIPDHILQNLRETLGEEVFDTLNKHEQLILITAHIEKTVDHARMMTILDIHPRDLSALLASLVEKSFLYQEGSGRGTVYFTAQAMVEDALLERVTEGTTAQRSGPDKERSGPSNTSSGPLELNSGPSDDELAARARPVASKKRAPGEDVRKVILELCALRALQLDELEKLLNRSSESLRKKYLQQLIKEHQIRLMYPTKPNHPHQAYITTGSEIDKEY